MMRLILMLLIVLGTLCASARAQSIIELRPSARVEPGRPVLLADVANLSGDEATALGATMIRDEVRAGEVITVDEVRRALDGSARVNWGRIALRGGQCTLAHRAEPVAPAPVRSDQPSPARIEGTVRQVVLMRISSIAQAPPEHLRLNFSPDDDEILNMTAAGRTVEVTPTGVSDRLPLAIRIFEGERIVRSRTIRVGVEVRRDVMIAGAARRRGEAIGEQDVTPGQQWLGMAARPARADQIIGASPRSRLAPGQVVMVEDVSPQIVVNKGEQVTVYCVSGTIVLTMRARATASARDGEMVLLEALDSRRTFHARMDGRGRAVVNVGTNEQERGRAWAGAEQGSRCR
jgi:flagella basal body P-ring formation protein FlgA